MKYLSETMFIVIFLLTSVGMELHAQGCNQPSQAPTLFCDYSELETDQVGFDFNNVGQTGYSFSYTVDGGAPITGTWTSPSNYQVLNLQPGQTVVFTLTWLGLCTPVTLTATCTTPCTTTTAPNFAAIPAFCEGSTPPPLLLVSPNGIPGTWSPAVINNMTSDDYVFTPTSGCSSPQTLNVTVTPKVTPTFNIPPTVCQYTTLSLPQQSTNSPPITGAWSPAPSTSTLGSTTYTFSPTEGQCVSATPVTVTITVYPPGSPDFAPIPAFCAGTPAPTLLTTSPNGVTGTWNPATINNTVSGNYVFTPTSPCATQQQLYVTVIPRVTPTFDPIPPICEGVPAPALPTTSNNNPPIAGTWNASVNTAVAGTYTYTFTPDPAVCATTAQMDVIVTAPSDPGFNDIAFCSGGNPPVLNTVSPNGISGTWQPAAIDNMMPGSYLFTPDSDECASTQTIDVTIYEAALTSVDWTVTDAFSDNQVITVLASAAGNYLYQLDYGPQQQSNVFENVSSGPHTITVYDANGCADPITEDDIIVINYPHFFTPNGDGQHDLWNIGGLDAAAQLFIFDRYGKLLKQLNPNGPGWDGTYLGVQMPSSDYWFKVLYTDKNISRQFNAHFSLKR